MTKIIALNGSPRRTWNTAQMVEAFYKDLIGSHKATFERLVGETETLCAVETWQFDDYSKYASTMFDVEARKKRHEEVFPQDLQKAFELGRRMAGSDS